MIAAIRREWRAWCEERVRSSHVDDWRVLFAPMLVFTALALLGRYTTSDGRPWMPDPWFGLASGIAACTFTMMGNLWVAHMKPSSTTVGVLYVLGTSAIQLALLELANAAHGTFFRGLIGLYVFSAAAHAYQMRTTPRRPFALLGWVLVLGFAASRAPSEEHRVVYALLFLLPLAYLVLGHWSASAHAAREREAALRAENGALALELELEQVGRLEEFLAEIAGRTHDIGGPALALDIALEHASDVLSRDPGAAREALERAKRHAADLRARVRRARDEVRAVSLPAFETVDLPDLAKSVVEGLRLRFPEVDIEVAGDLASASVRGGRLALARVLENLGGNGAEAARLTPSPKLRLAWRSMDDAVEITIEDNGPGFDPNAAVIGGIGVGLMSASRIVTTSNGTIAVDRSETIGGARCTVRLNVRDGSAGPGV
jgi:signal transduction histidine kinase